MKAAMSGVKAEPAATMAVPSPSPSGISPAGPLENNSSSWAWLILRSWGTSYAMVGLLWCDGYRGARAASASMTSAAFSPIMYTALAMKNPGMRGNTEASTTRRPSVPWTQKFESSTPLRSRGPMAQVQEAWCPHAWRRANSRISSSDCTASLYLLRPNQVILLDPLGHSPHELHRLHEGVEVLAGGVAALLEVAEVDEGRVAGIGRA